MEYQYITLIYTNDAGLLTAKRKIKQRMYSTLVNMYNTQNKKESMQTPIAVCKILSGGSMNRILLTTEDAMAEWPDKLKAPADLFIQRYITPKGRKATNLRVIWTLKNGFQFYIMTNVQRLDGKLERNPNKSILLKAGSVEIAHMRYGDEFVPITNFNKTAAERFDI